jgi:predicted CXXCH cytochrome family protein
VFFKSLIENETMIKLFIAGLCCITFLTFPAGASTLKRESKDECSICHVLWFNSLAKGGQTLLERTDSPIVIAGSTGLASSREMCNSCHGGYIADSRNKIFRENKHQLAGKVPEGLTLPAIFRLTKDNEFYCGTCHGFHDVRAMGEVGQTPFTRMDNDRSQMCIACHADKVKSQKYAGHPVMKHAEGLSVSLISEKGPKFSPEDEIICQSCHTAHGRRAMIAPVENSDICLICHGSYASLVDTKHDLRVSLPDEKNMKQQPVSVSGPCGTCHTPHSASGPKLWARKFDREDSPSQMCLSCHDPERADGRVKGTGRYSHPINVDQRPAANGQALGPTTKGILPLFPRAGEKQPAITVQCQSCHNPHRWNPDLPDSRGGKDVEGDASDSFLRIPGSNASALCLACHSDYSQLLDYDHNLGLTAPDHQNIQGSDVSVTGPCGACHIPHNASGPKLWARELSEDGPLLPQYCRGCHSENGPAKDKTTGEMGHPVDVASKGMDISDPDRVSAELPLFDEAGGRESGETIRCLTCHDPHVWTANGIPSPGEGDIAVNKAGGVKKNAEGDARSSFLRKSASPSPDLCATCHEGAALLEGTDHDLSATAPSTRNLLGQRVEESGQCGVCHAVHNSPSGVKLWARAFGPVDDNQHPMNALCTSCHSEDQVAKDKIPPVATHPEKLLITNIMRSNSPGTGYTPLFNETGEPAVVGDLSCSSCHSSHIWDHRLRQKGPKKNIEGDASTSFLRMPVTDTVCLDCHGEEALWRHTYFHSIPKRRMLRGRGSVP